MSQSRRRSTGVYFDPPLFLQRQRWLLEEIRRRSPKYIVEVGCGEGSLIKALAQPQPVYVAPSNEWKVWFCTLTGVEDKRFFDDDNHLYAPERIVAVDIDEKALRCLEEELDSLRHAYTPRFGHGVLVEGRCEDFVRLSADKYGSPDLIVASEVIEHLQDDKLTMIGPVLFDRLQPKTLLLTTPNYSFNKHFSTSFLDPTGRTQRWFRHDDHQFEWTADEFRRWCADLAAKHNYRLTHFGGVGRGVDMRPPTTDDDTFASQVAIFERIDLAAPSSGSLLEVKRSRPTFRHEFEVSRDQSCSQDEREVLDIIITVAHAYATPFDDDDVYEVDLYRVWQDLTVQEFFGGRLESFVPMNKEMISLGYTLFNRGGQVFLRFHDPFMERGTKVQ